ncbi:MAG: Cys-every-fifth RiPP peptide CefA [Methanosarcinales archaeon]|nr:Cys-every-fifth RiPP peptide CefA [Methanosarcinales archaeon]
MEFVVQPAAKSVAEMQATIYEHRDYGGRSQKLGQGRYNMSQLSIGNDTLSSLKVPDGLMISLYENADFKGDIKSATEDTPWVGDDFNYKISAIVVQLAAVLYQHRDYQGKSQGLTLGRYNMNQLAIGNDTLSSLKVPSGLKVTLNEHADFTGNTKTFTQNTGWVGDDFNDKISAIEVSLFKVSIPETVLMYGDTIALRSQHEKYLVAESNGDLNANKDKVEEWEKFSLIRSGETKHNVLVSFGDTVSLRSHHNQYVVAEQDGLVNANSSDIGGLEKWTIIRSGKTQHKSFVCSSDIITLKSSYGKYMVAEADGRANANSDAIDTWEKWIILNCRQTPFIVSGGEETSDQSAEATIDSLTYAADACAGDACGGAACSEAACGGDACGGAACSEAACAGDACAGDACGGAACGADACGADACGGAACGGDACAGDACGADACGGNVCIINLCPLDACALDACALDVIPIIPGI